MRILFICKWHPQQRDLMLRPYGRFFHIPSQLAAVGHDIQVALVGHRGLPSTRQRFGNVDWCGLDVRTQGPLTAYRQLAALAETFAPECVVGCSDTWVGWLAHRIAQARKARLVLDAYDNFESYMPFNLPLHRLWRNALLAADSVTAAGPQLAELLSRYARKISIVPMAADPGFVAMDQGAARSALGLPLDSPLIGYFGGWAKNRGTDIVSGAFQKILAHRPDARLVVSGRPPATVTSQAGVIATGYVPDEQLPVLTNAVSVACVVTTHSSFGRYSYPAKLCEAMACGTPLAATATDPVRWMLGPDHRFLAPVDSAAGLADTIIRALPAGKVEYGKRWTWAESAVAFYTAIQ